MQLYVDHGLIGMGDIRFATSLEVVSSNLRSDTPFWMSTRHVNSIQ